ncbi:hypothetical protein ACOKFD_01755 [Flagellimonas sp. S174]|uniref:hypothetical protein n=1 Tax=Flagellimonas sp. S174 TaxID=3410790 RepID=UPI003BF5CF7F
MKFIRNLFRPSKKYKGVWPIKVYVLKLFFLLMFLFAAKDAWSELMTHKGEWNPEIAIAWCAIAAYTTLSSLGIFHTLKMLPIMLFMFFYKGLWLMFVAYPLYKKGQLAVSEAADWVPIFMLIIIPMIFTPWQYVFKTYVLGKE